MSKKVIFTTDYFDVYDDDTMIGVEPKSLNVVILPYIKENNLPEKLGVLKEFNPHRRNDYSITLITGTAEGEDPDILAAAMRELKEESGLDVSDPARWTFLGFMTTSKIVNQEHPCFACDVTDIEIGEKEGDGSEGEKKSEFMFLPVREALDTNDCFIPTLFMKIFKYIFGFDAQTNTNNEITNKDGEPEQPSK